MVLTGKDAKGENITSEYNAKDMVAIKTTGDVWKNITKDSLNPENTPYTIQDLNGILRPYSVGDLYTAYSVDPTELNSRLATTPTPNPSSDLAIGLGNIGIGLCTFFAGFIGFNLNVAKEALRPPSHYQRRLLTLMKKLKSVEN